MPSSLEIIFKHEIRSVSELADWKTSLFTGDLLDWHYDLYLACARSTPHNLNYAARFDRRYYQESLANCIENEKQFDSVRNQPNWEKSNYIFFGLVNTQFTFFQNGLGILAVGCGLDAFGMDPEFRKPFVTLIREFQKKLCFQVPKLVNIYTIGSYDLEWSAAEWPDFSVSEFIEKRAFPYLVQDYKMHPLPINRYLDEESLDAHPLAFLGDYFFIDRGEDLSQITYEYVPPYVEEDDE